MLIHGLLNSILPCRGLSKLIINGEPLTKSNNSPRKKRPQIATPPPPIPSPQNFRCPPWGLYGYFLELHNKRPGCLFKGSNWGRLLDRRCLKERGVYSHNCRMHNKNAYGGNINRVCKCRAVPMPCTDSYCSSKSQYTVNVDIRILIHGHCAVIVSLACVADIITLGKDFTIK